MPRSDADGSRFASGWGGDLGRWNDLCEFRVLVILTLLSDLQCLSESCIGNNSHLLPIRCTLPHRNTPFATLPPQNAQLPLSLHPHPSLLRLLLRRFRHLCRAVNLRKQQPALLERVPHCP